MMANTAIQSIAPWTLTRSTSPIQGVGWSAAIRMDSRPEQTADDYQFSNLTGSNWVGLFSTEASTADWRRLSLLAGTSK